MAAPSLRIPVSADVSKFQEDMRRTGDIATKATLAITKQVIQMNAGFLASQGAAGAATIAFGRVLGVLGPIGLGIMVVRDAFKLMGYATDLAKQKIAEYNDVAEKAGATGFTTETFQRITKGAATAAVGVSDLTDALKKFNEVSTPKLGGSGLQQRLDTLTKAGNFTGNTGVSALGLSTDSEGRLRAIVQLVDQAMQKGERLAAIDLAETAFGPKVASALRADAGYLDQMLQKADALKQSQLISDADLGRAIELKERMDAAQKTLADKWKPVQDDLAKLGMNYHESWVNITEDLAKAVGYATDIYTALHKVPDWFANRIGNASIWKSITDATGAMGLNSTPESMGITTDPTEIAAGAKYDKLRAAMQNHANMTRSMQQASDIVNAVRGDKSKDPAKNVEEEADAFDRASDAIEKHINRLQADIEAVGLGAGSLAQLRAQADLTTAAQKAYGTVSAETAKNIQDMAARVGEAAAAFEKAKVASQIDFSQKAAFLSDTDVSIARQLAGVYGNDVQAALKSTEAKAVRATRSLRKVRTKPAKRGKESK